MAIATLPRSSTVTHDHDHDKPVAGINPRGSKVRSDFSVSRCGNGGGIVIGVGNPSTGG